MKSMMKKDSQLKVLFISDHFYPEAFLGNEIPSYLCAHGCSVDVLTQNPAYPEGIIYPGNPNPLFRITRMSGIRVFRLKTITGYRDSLSRKIANYLWFMFAATIFTLFSMRSYDTLFVYHVGSLTEALPLYVAKHIFGKRTSIWTLDIWPDSVFSFGFKRTPIISRALDRFVSAIYNSCDSVMVGSPGFIGKIGRFMPAGRQPIFVPQWAPKALFAEVDSSFAIDEECMSFVFAGNVGTQQNLDRVISAFAAVERGGHRAHLHIVGDGRSLEVVKATAQRLCTSSIHFHPRIPQGQILRLLGSADACVLSLNPDPSIELTLPAKFQTYLHSERPILCVARGESRYLVEENRLGEVAEPDSIESIAAAIKKICNYTEKERLEIAERMRKLTLSFREEVSMQKILFEVAGISV